MSSVYEVNLETGILDKMLSGYTYRKFSAFKVVYEVMDKMLSGYT
jgi:hypothetical protein